MVTRDIMHLATNSLPLLVTQCIFITTSAVADPGGARGPWPPPGPVKIGHKKDGCRRWPHRFHVSRPPPYPAAGSATALGRYLLQLSTLNRYQPTVSSGNFF